jgi:hypothetical protein
MLRIAMLILAILTIAVRVSNAEAAYCSQRFDIDSARNRWAAARQASAHPAH